MTDGVPALWTPEWGILQQVHWSFSQLQSSEHRAERWSLLFLFPLAEEAHFTRTERLGMPEAYGWGPCMVAKGWMKDAWVTLPWAWHGQLGKAGFLSYTSNGDFSSRECLSQRHGSKSNGVSSISALVGFQHGYVYSAFYLPCVVWEVPFV